MNGLWVTYAIWLREVKLFVRERTRIVAMIAQPLLYLVIMGNGITKGLTLNGGGGAIDYRQFMYPGIIGMSALFTSMFSAMSIIWDREFGFLKEVLVAPAPRWAVAAGKILGGATVATIQSLILIALAPVAGIWWTPAMVVLLPVLSFLISCAMTSLGVAIASRMHSMQGFQMIMNFLVMPLYFLSGAMFQVTTADPWMKGLMLVDPLTYGVDAMRTVVMSAMPPPPGASSAVQWAQQTGLILGSPLLDVSVMLVTAVALAVFAGWRFSRAD